MNTKRVINCLIFSKDRAMQLDALLNSIQKNLTQDSDIFWFDILYQATSPAFLEAYTILRKQYPEFVFLRERNFEDDFRLWLRDLISDDYVMFLVDDDIFYDSIPKVEKIPWSFRPGDFDYLFALDGCVYKARVIIRLLDFRFKNPSDLEAGFFKKSGKFSFKLNRSTPCVVGVHANRVSDSPGAPFFGGADWSALRLNQMYLSGKRIDLEATLKSVEITDTHQEIRYEFTDS